MLLSSHLLGEVEALAHRVVFENGRAVGVEYAKAGRTITARANREVILSGGAINSPQLLHLSGIGPRGLLQGLGIEVNFQRPLFPGEPSQKEQQLYYLNLEVEQLLVVSSTQKLNEQ